MALFIICLLFILKGSVNSNQKLSVDTDKLKFNKLNECLRCKLLTDSFNTWFVKTSRGKHEGGDAAWEESKLKTYSRSEMRLVEIQEHLCSEVKTHRDDCYTLAAETELVLEKWWFHENYDSLDLYTWLCIENLQYCCPPNHFGEMCTPCTRDKSNKICGGNGKCDGEGTRNGNGTCICKKGYSGINCDKCASNFYNATNICKPCHQSCNECYADGPNTCVKCAIGWILNGGACEDINECLDSSRCKSSEFCVNREGSYKCKSCDKTCKTCLGPGTTNCTSCKDDQVLWTGTCRSKDNHEKYLRDSKDKTAMYLCLCIIIILIFRQSWLMGSFVAFVSVFLYYYVSSEEFTTIID